MSRGADTRLLADVGGTNARFAWQDVAGGPLLDCQTLKCADYDTIELAIRAYLTSIQRGVPRQCAMGIANPVVGDQVQMTNHHWSFSISALQRSLGMERLLVINDFTALALAIPLLQAHELQQFGGLPPVPQKAIGLLGAGTGLGMGGLVPFGSQWAPIEGEGGHISLAPCNDLESAVVVHLRHRFGRVSLERVLSGPGLVSLHEALQAVQGTPGGLREPTSAEIVDAALAGRDPVCQQVLNMFCALLGGAAGDLALMLGARGGIYVGGGIVPRIGDWLAQSPFRQRFEDKGRLSVYLKDIPVYVIHTDVSPALLGVGQALR